MVLIFLMVAPMMTTGQKLVKSDSLNYYTFMAEAYFDMVGDYASSAHWVSKAIRLDPMDFELFQMRALARGNTGQLKGEAADYSMVLQLDPDNIAAYVGRANALLKLRRFEEAIRDLDFLIMVDPQYYGYYYQRGKAKLELKDKAGACQDFRTASRLGSKDAFLQVYELCLE